MLIFPLDSKSSIQVNGRDPRATRSDRHESDASARVGGPLYGAFLVKRDVSDGFLSSALGRVSRRNAPTLWQRYTDWERGRVKAVSREAGAREREP